MTRRSFPARGVKRQAVFWQDRLTALKAGAIGFLAKPFGAPALIKCVESALRRGGTHA